MQDHKNKAFRARLYQEADAKEKAYIESHCSEHARRWGARAGYEGSELAPIGHRGNYENWKDGILRKFMEVR